MMEEFDLEKMFDYVLGLQMKIKEDCAAKGLTVGMRTKNDCQHHSQLAHIDNNSVCTGCGIIVEANVAFDVSFDQQQQSSVIVVGSSVTSIGLARQGGRDMKRLAIIEQRLSNKKYQATTYKNASAFKQFLCCSIGNKLADLHVRVLNQFIDRFWLTYAKHTKTKGDNSRAICLVMIMLYLVEKIREARYHQPLIECLLQQSTLKQKHYHNALSYIARTFTTDDDFLLGINLNLSLLSKLLFVKQ